MRQTHALFAWLFVCTGRKNSRFPTWEKCDMKKTAWRHARRSVNDRNSRYLARHDAAIMERGTCHCRIIMIYGQP